MKKILTFILLTLLVASCAFSNGSAESTGPSTEESANSNVGYEVTEADPSLPTVYFIRDITPESLLRIYEALGWSASGNVAVKMSTGEPPRSNYLRPELIGDLIKSIDGTIVECNTAYGGSRAETARHMQVARDHGFLDIADVDIMDSEGEERLQIEGGVNLSYDIVGSHFFNYDSMLVLSHFKGHAMAGFGGAMKNISIGVASSNGKRLIHAGDENASNIFGDQNQFLENMAEAAMAVDAHFGENIAYINVLNRLSVDCDCDGNPAEPDMHDIGILASLDPVAVDQASIDMVYSAEDSSSLVARIESRNGLHIFEHADAIGFGERHYNLIEL